MIRKNILLILMLLSLVVLSACGGATPDAMTEIPATEAAMPHDTTVPEAMEQPTQEAMADAPAWFGASFTDAATGQNFTINEFKGKVVLVETMAVWCPKCYTQQLEIQAFHTALGARDDFVSISLDIDPNEDAAILQSYVQRAGFTWRYAVAPPEASREIAQLYGDLFLNPPSTPMLIIDRKGVAHPMPFGIKSAQDLMDFIQPFLNEGA